MATEPQEIDDLRRQMAQIRRELHDDVKGVVEGAEAATDWRRYIRSYPWASLGVALAIGYLVVPRRQRDRTTTINVDPAEIARAVAAETPRVIEKEKPGRGIVGSLFGMVAPVAFRAAQGYALQFFEQWMSQKMAQQLQAHPELAAAFGGPGQAPPGQAGHPGHPGQAGHPGRPPGPVPGAPRF